jgi:hypothetical protein
MAAQLKNLMQGLYYPAVTGTGVVLVLYRLTAHSTLVEILSDFALWYSLLFLIFFSASYVAISMIPGKNYTTYEFVLDSLEVVLAFAVFLSLGLFDTTSVPPPPANLRGVYAAIALLALVQTLWRLFLGDQYSQRLWFLRLTSLAVAVAGFLFLHQYRWFNTAALAVLLVCTARYLSIMKSRASALDAK